MVRRWMQKLATLLGISMILGLYSSNVISRADESKSVNGKSIETMNAASLHTVDTTDQQEARIWYAHDCSYEAVKIALLMAKDGDIVRVPKGEADWCEKGALSITTSISLQGCGNDQTKITNASISVNAPGVNIDGFTFVTNKDPAVVPKGHSGGRITVTSSDFRIHDNRFVTYLGRPIDVYEAYGLIDNNIFEFYGMSNELIHIYGPKDSWSTPSTFGTAEAVYIEDNLFTTTEGFGSTQCVQGNFNSRFVFRENTVYNCKVDGHGIWSNGAQSHYMDWDYYQQHSVRHYEIYNNHFRATEKAYWYYHIELRGGTGIVFNNEFTGPSYYDYAPNVGLREYLLWNNNGNAVEKEKYMDPSYYPAHDQLGRGMNQTLEPLYLWNNTTNGKWLDSQVSGPSQEAIAQYGSTFTGQDIVKKNRDYYEYVENFDGTEGVGVGLLANRPATCTTGVGYFATDKKTLYKAVSKDTWEESYTPYVYPHPLHANSTEPPIDPTAEPSDKPLPWNAEVYFSGTQGENQWYYHEWDGTAYAELTYNSASGTWRGNGSTVGATIMSPGEKVDAVREWRATKQNFIEIVGTIKKAYNNTSGDGVVVTILKNDEVLWGPQWVAGNETDGVDYSVRTEVQPGDSIYFRVNRKGQHWNDTLLYSPTITIVDGIEIEPVFGDMNSDGKVDMSDVAFVARNIGKASESTDWSAVKRADVNTDGKINVMDLVTVARKIP